MRNAAGDGSINVWLISLDALFTVRYEVIQAGTTRQRRECVCNLLAKGRIPRAIKLFRATPVGCH